MVGASNCVFLPHVPVLAPCLCGGSGEKDFFMSMFATPNAGATNNGLIKEVRFPAIMRTPVIGAPAGMRGPLVISYKDPLDDPEGFKKAIKKRYLNDFNEIISTEAGWLENLTETPDATGFKPTKLYFYQKKHLSNHKKYRWMNKSRQVGASYSFAGEGLAKCHLLDFYSCIFVSFNQEEANEKINYSRMLYEGLPLKYQRKLVVDRVTALEFEKRTITSSIAEKERKVITRLISHPQRAVRGRGGNVDVVLDEFAHFIWAEKVYVAAVPVITRGFGQITVASSPLGKTGLHWKIGADKKSYPVYSRQYVPWWACNIFLNKKSRINFFKVQRKAPLMATEERVLKYGGEAIVQAFYSSDSGSFCQEYELRPFDESEAYYPMNLIKACTFEALSGEVLVDENDIYGDNPIAGASVHRGLDFKCYDTIESLAVDCRKGKVGKILFAGYDVGRYENASELIVLEELRNFDNFQMMRLNVGGRNMPFEQQQALLEKAMQMLPIRKLAIDVTGIGKQLGEYMYRKHHSRVDCVDFNITNKQDMAVNVKIRMEEQYLGYPNDRNLLKQIHSIKREISSGNQVKFNAEKSKHDHGDKFWALALASWMGSPLQILKNRAFVKICRIPLSSNVIQLGSLKKFPKTKDKFVLPVCVKKPPFHSRSLGGFIAR